MAEQRPALTVMAIAAVGRGPDGSLVIGRAGAIPWKAPADMAAFRAATTGHSVVMGAKTWDSLPRRPLPLRANYVLSRTPGSDPRWSEARRAGVGIVPSLAALVHDLERTCPPIGEDPRPIERVGGVGRPFPSGCPIRDFDPSDPLSRILWVVGGAALYGAAVGSSGDDPLATRVILTEVDIEVPDGDAFFPVLDPALYQETGTLDLRPEKGPGCVVREYALRGEDGLAPFLPRLGTLLGGGRLST